MIKTILRKTIYKKTSDEEFAFHWELAAKRNALNVLCWLIYPFMWFIPWISLLIIDTKEIPISTQIISCIPMALYFAVVLLMVTYFKKETVSFTSSIADKLYFKGVTTKGKALVKEDFELIKEKAPKLYYVIYTGLCQGHCYSVCFELLKLLKTGEMVYFAAKCFDKEENEDKPYTMHVLFVKDGWAYDSFGSKQYELTKLLNIYNGTVYKTFSYSDIDGVSYDEFRMREKDSLHAWGEEQNCYVSFAKDLE